jgi:hypothetical protein
VRTLTHFTMNELIFPEGNSATLSPELAALSGPQSGCSLSTQLCALAQHGHCARFTRKLLRELPVGTLVQSQALAATSWLLENRREEHPRVMMELLTLPSDREALWAEVKRRKLQGQPCFFFLPGECPDRAQRLALYRRATTPGITPQPEAN